MATSFAHDFADRVLFFDGGRIVEAALATMDKQAEALFISCTAVRAASVVQGIEEKLKKPVVTSNQAMAWRSLRLAGYGQPVDGFGELLQ